jgi:hypothetical protein
VNRPQRKHFDETDRKENTAAPIVAFGPTTKKTLVVSIVARLLVARQRPSFVDCCLTVRTSQ